MAAILQCEEQGLREAARARNRTLAKELSAAAMEGDDRRVKQILAELLRCQARRPEAKRHIQLQALEDLFHTMRSMAMTDDLTGLNNRRGFLRLGTRWLEVANRERLNVCVVHVDIDNLKLVNDTSGHCAGDMQLRRTADLLRELFPNYDVYDVIGRLGGDEFAVLTSSRSAVDPDTLARRILQAVERLPSFDRCPTLSLSVGVASVDAQQPLAITELLKRAERATYAHKLTKRARRAERRVQSRAAHLASMSL